MWTMNEMGNFSPEITGRSGRGLFAALIWFIAVVDFLVGGFMLWAGVKLSDSPLALFGVVLLVWGALSIFFLRKRLGLSKNS